MLVILPPLLFALLFIHHYLIDARGGSLVFEAYLIVSAVAALCVTYALTKWRRQWFQDLHVVLSAMLASVVYFVVWAIFYVLAEEIYILTSGNSWRWIYTDESPTMGTAVGIGGLPALVAFHAIFGVIFGMIYGVFRWIWRGALANIQGK